VFYYVLKVTQPSCVANKQTVSKQNTLKNSTRKPWRTPTCVRTYLTSGLRSFFAYDIL